MRRQRQVTEHPQRQKSDPRQVIVQPAQQALTQRLSAARLGQELRVRSQAAGFTLRQQRQQALVARRHALEFGVRQAAVAVLIGGQHEQLGELLDLVLARSRRANPRNLRARLLRQVQRDHALDLDRFDATIAVQVVDLKGQAQLLARAAEHQASHGLQELVTAHLAVAVAVQNGEDAARQKLATDAQRVLEVSDVDLLIAARVGLERLA
ncbi:MAG: hypothetical protein QM756_39290 [Polyangiaceae bacterium]